MIHFNTLTFRPKTLPSTFTGHAETQQPAEMLPSVLQLLGAEGLTGLRRMVQTTGNGKASVATGEEEEEEVAGHVENLDEAWKNGVN